LTIREAIQIVIDECPDPYAKTYARAALELGGSDDAVVVSTDAGVGIAHKKTGEMMLGEELKIQILYIISNTQYWRGERAKEVKKVLKQASK